MQCYKVTVLISFITLTTTESLEQLSEAAATITFCYTLSSYLAAGLVATGSAYAHGIITVLRKLGIEVNGSMVFYHDPVYDSGDIRQDSLKTLVENHGDIKSFAVSNRQQYQFYSLIKKEQPDFVILRHTGLAPLSAKIGIPGVAVGDENKAIGYQGILNLAETVLAVLQRRKFNEDLAKYLDLNA